MNLVDLVNQHHQLERVSSYPDFRSGDTVSVHVRITEGSKSRVQLFQGTVIAIKEKGKISGHFRVRKVANGMGVERVFPYHCPNVEKIEIVRRGKVRRSKLYYLRDRSGKSARIKIDYERK